MSLKWHKKALPRSSCRESYTVRYTLEKKCPKERCDIKQDLPRDLVDTEDGREILKLKSNPCRCEDE